MPDKSQDPPMPGDYKPERSLDPLSERHARVYSYILSLPLPEDVQEVWEDEE